MVNRDRLQVRLEHQIQKWNVPWCDVQTQKAVPWIEVESVAGNMREFLSWTQEHCRIDATIFFRAKQANQHLLFRVPVNAKTSLTRVPKNISSGQRARFVAPFETTGRTPRLDSTLSSQRHTDHRESSLHTKGIYRVDRGTYIDSALREIYDAYKAVRSASSNRDRVLADHEQDSLLSNGDYKKPTILQLPLDCVDHAAESITASVSVRERSMHSEDNQTLSLRDVDPIADDGVLGDY